jgi:hypothetical protein
MPEPPVVGQARPRIGQIVGYALDSRPGEMYPAIITAVVAIASINAYVFTDQGIKGVNNITHDQGKTPGSWHFLESDKPDKSDRPPLPTRPTKPDEPTSPDKPTK